MGKDTIVIADNMNYIKGSRYQMYCQAREVGVRTCTVSGAHPSTGRVGRLGQQLTLDSTMQVFVATPPSKCNEWNSTRPEGARYLDSTLVWLPATDATRSMRTI